MSFRISILNFVFLLILIPKTFADCDVRTVLKSTAPSAKGSENPNRPVSDWGNDARNSQVNAKYRGYAFHQRTHSNIPVAQGSLGETYPELSLILKDVNYFQMDDAIFKNEFTRVNGAPPKFDDYKKFYKSRIDLYEEGLLMWAAQVRRHPNPVTESVLEAIDQRVKALRNTFREMNERNYAYLSHDIHKHINGQIQEMIAITHLPHIKKTSVQIKDMPQIRSLLEERLGSLQTRLKTQPGEYERLVSQYPDLFNPPRLKELDPARKSKMTEFEKAKFAIHNFLDREIDFVREVDNKTYWLELKSRRDPMSYSEFKNGDKSRNLSPSSAQIQAMRQGLEYLGLKDKIGLEYFVTSGMDSEVKKELLQSGIHILEFK